MRVRASLVELFTRVVKTARESDKEIYLNGENNLYPNEIERVINNSPNAKAAAKMMAKFISGLGVSNDVIVNKEKGYLLSDIVKMASKSIAYHNGVYFHIGYGLDQKSRLRPNKLDVLNYTKVRISKEDDNENRGRLFYKDYQESDSFFKKNNAQWFYPYNPSEKVVEAQIIKDSENKEGVNTLVEKLKNYRGQVYYLNLTPEYQYSLPVIDCAFNDADSDYRMSLYSNTQLRTGFLGKTIFVTQGLDQEENKDIKEKFEKFMGAENSADSFHLDIDRVDTLDNALKVIQLQPQFDDKLFTETAKSIKNRLFIAFNNIPEILVSAGTGALFGPNSETYLENKIFYCEQTDDERVKLESTLNMLGFQTKIIPIITKEQVEKKEI